ncbi:MAG TPA: HEAT repeat domain-containing protein [Gemmata sp.]
MSAAVRVVGVWALVALGAGAARADDKDPVFEGKKFSQWVSAVQNDKSARQRALAVEALGKIWVLDPKTDALSHVSATLRTDPSAAVRAQCAVVFAGLREADMLNHGAKPLIEVLKTEKESRVRREIIAAMSKHPAVCAAGIESLVPSLKDPEPAVRAGAAEALAQAGGKAKGAAGPLTELLKDREKAVRAAAVFALGRIEPEAGTTIAETFAMMLGTEKEPDIKRELLTSIRLLGEKSAAVVTALATALTDKEDEVRRGAARTLGPFGTAAEPAAEALFRVLTTDPVKDIRVDAVRAFGSALGPTGVKARLKDLRPLLDPKRQPDYEVRLALVDEIAALGFEHLGADLASKDRALRAEAEETLKALRLRLSDPQVKVRENAGIAIHKIEKKPEPKKEPKKEP